MNKLHTLVHGYAPDPPSFDHVKIPSDLEALIETLAQLNHDAWARARLESGWRYGPQRDDQKLLHPCLVPYASLSEEEKEIDRDTSRAVIRAVIGFGFQITKP
jgi:hypothetical protein